MNKKAKIKNTGSAAIDNVNLSSSAPQDWVIEFPVDKIDSMAANSQQTLDIKIKPASKAISGDYMVTLTASGKQASAESLQVRVTVVTSSIWGWVGVAVIIIVIVGLAFVFMRFLAVSHLPGMLSDFVINLQVPKSIIIF